MVVAGRRLMAPAQAREGRRRRGKLSLVRASARRGRRVGIRAVQQTQAGGLCSNVKCGEGRGKVGLAVEEPAHRVLLLLGLLLSFYGVLRWGLGSALLRSVPSIGVRVWSVVPWCARCVLFAGSWFPLIRHSSRYGSGFPASAFVSLVYSLPVSWLVLPVVVIVVGHTLRCVGKANVHHHPFSDFSSAWYHYN